MAVDHDDSPAPRESLVGRPEWTLIRRGQDDARPAPPPHPIWGFLGKLTLATIVPLTAGLFGYQQTQLAQVEAEAARAQTMVEAREARLVSYQEKLLEQNQKLLERAFSDDLDKEERLKMLDYTARVTLELAGVMRKTGAHNYLGLSSLIVLPQIYGLETWAMREIAFIEREREVSRQVLQAHEARLDDLESERKEAGETIARLDEPEASLSEDEVEALNERADGLAEKRSELIAKAPEVEKAQQLIDTIGPKNKDLEQRFSGMATPTSKPSAPPIQVHPPYTGWSLQLASNKDPNMAVAARKKIEDGLSSEGVEAYVLRRGGLWVVMAGDISSREEAEKLLPKAKKVLKQGGYVRHVPEFCPDSIPLKPGVFQCVMAAEAPVAEPAAAAQTQAQAQP